MQITDIAHVMRDSGVRGKDVEREERERETEEQQQDRLARRTQTPHEHLPRMTAEFQTRSLSHVSTPLTHAHITVST